LEKTNLFNWLNLGRKETRRSAGVGWVPTCGEFVFNFFEKWRKYFKTSKFSSFLGFLGGKKEKKNPK
jgi:hypothetical protein